MKLNWKTPFTAVGGMGAAVAMLALARSPVAANPEVMYAAAAVTSQFAAAFGAVGSRLDHLGKRRDGEIPDERAVNRANVQKRADVAEPVADTATRSEEYDPARRQQDLRQEQRKILAEMQMADVNDAFHDLDALLDRLGQVRSEHRRLDATAELAEPGRENVSRGQAPPETARQDTQPALGRAGASDDARRTTDDRAAPPPRATEESDTNERGAARAQPHRNETSSGARSPHDVPQQAAPTNHPGGQRQTWDASAGEMEGAETDFHRSGEAPTGPLGTEHNAASGDSVEESATGRDEGESQAPVTDPSATRASPEAGTQLRPPSPQPVPELSRGPWVPTGRYPGPGVTAEQLRAMQGAAPKFDPPEAVTDAASRKQAALAAMTRDRTGIAKRSEGTTAQPDGAHDPEPRTGADPAPSERDREME